MTKKKAKIVCHKTMKINKVLEVSDRTRVHLDYDESISPLRVRLSLSYSSSELSTFDLRKLRVVLDFLIVKIDEVEKRRISKIRQVRERDRNRHRTFKT